MPQPQQVCLSGVRVLDASRVLAGPFCGQVLGDLGAEVLKLERPGAGDETRGWGPPFIEFQGDPHFSPYLLSCNRNKRSFTLDLSRPEGIEIFHDLVKRSDILLENFKASSADKLGFGPDRLLQINPRLIICSISGYGRTGPLADQPGYDFAMQALSGLMSITGPVEGPPCKVGVAVTDIITGLYAAIGLLACLHARAQSGHGYHIDLALLDCAVACQVNVVQAYLATGHLPARQGNAHLQIVPYQLFQTADSWLVLAVGNDGQWQRFCRAAQRPDLAEPRFLTNAQRVQGRAELIALLEPLLRSKTTADWQEVLRPAEVPHAPVWTHADLFAHPQMDARGLRLKVTDPQGRPVDLVGSPLHIAGCEAPTPLAPPALGQHTDEVLHELLGLSAERVRELRARGVV
jgi:crotonobetainyl-CoA:carnitine CoA-transferase CaiB-like acyl-CoA transferase